MTFRVTLLLLAIQSATLTAADWPQFLGPDRNGISAETGLIDSFPSDGPEVVWRAPLGVGMANVAVADGSVVTLYQDSRHQYVVSLDEKTGKEQWKTDVASAYQNGQGHGPRATPTIRNGMIYVFTGDGVLAALDSKNGKLQWNVNTLDELGGKVADYGMSSSPLLVDKTVVVHVGGRTGTVAAFNIADGKLVWQASRGSAGYSSPVLMNLAGAKQIVTIVGAAVLGINPADGNVLWQYDYQTDYDCNTASPVQLSDDRLLISAGENHGSTILQVTRKGYNVGVKAVWESLGKSSVLRAEWQTPALIDGHLFGMDNMGSAGPITNLVCVRVSDGKQVWMKPRFGKSNLTLADGKLFISNMAGELILVKASTDAFVEISRAPILQKQTRQAPVIANGRLYLRDDNEVVCLNVKK